TRDRRPECTGVEQRPGTGFARRDRDLHERVEAVQARPQVGERELRRTLPATHGYGASTGHAGSHERNVRLESRTCEEEVVDKDAPLDIPRSQVWSSAAPPS